MARRSAAKKFKLPILAKFHNYAVVGVPPEIMGVGPVKFLKYLLYMNLNIPYKKF